MSDSDGEKSNLEKKKKRKRSDSQNSESPSRKKPKVEENNLLKDMAKVFMKPGLGIPGFPGLGLAGIVPQGQEMNVKPFNKKSPSMMMPFPFMLPPFGFNNMMPPPNNPDINKKPKDPKREGGPPFFAKSRRKEISRASIEEGLKLKGIEKVPIGLQVFLSSNFNFRESDQPLLMNIYRKNLTDLWRVAKDSKEKSVAKEISKCLEEIVKSKKEKKKGETKTSENEPKEVRSLFDKNLIPANLEEKRIVFEMRDKEGLLEAVKKARDSILANN